MLKGIVEQNDLCVGMFSYDFWDSKSAAFADRYHYILELSFELQRLVTNLLGQPVENILLKNKKDKIRLGNNYPTGTYFIYFKIVI